MIKVNMAEPVVLFASVAIGNQAVHGLMMRALQSRESPAVKKYCFLMSFISFRYFLNLILAKMRVRCCFLGLKIAFKMACLVCF